MTDQNDTDEADSPLTLDEVLEFGREQVEEEAESFDGDMPRHAGKLVVSRSADLLQVLNNIQVAEASEEVLGGLDEDDEPADAMVPEVEEAVVDVLLSLSAVAYEYDVDIADRFEQRMAFVESYQAFEDAMEEAEDIEEAFESMDDEHDEFIEEQVVDPRMGGGVEVGENVDDDEYDADEERDRHFQ